MQPVLLFVWIKGTGCTATSRDSYHPWHFQVAALSTHSRNVCWIMKSYCYTVIKTYRIVHYVQYFMKLIILRESVLFKLVESYRTRKAGKCVLTHVIYKWIPWLQWIQGNGWLHWLDSKTSLPLKILLVKIVPLNLNSSM